MKNNLDITIEKIKGRKTMGIMAHMVTGYPTFELSKQIAGTLVDSGADIIEIQIPFSDPMADGPLIVEACQQSLDNGIKVEDSFKLAKFISKSFRTPVVLMTYANILVRMGIEKFCADCVRSGVSGIIIPDLPYDSEECKELQTYAKKMGIHLIYVISPSVQEYRLKEIKKTASGFIYCTSRQGTTGTGKEFSKNIDSYLARVARNSPVPLAVGFGISTSEDLNLIKKYATMGIIGSALIDIIKNNKNAEILIKIRKFMSQFIK